MFPFPKWKDLPLDESHPEHSAWFQWGKDDQLGTLNHLTPETILEARKEIQIGERVSLNWALDLPQYPYMKRKPFVHTLIHKSPRPVNDDEIILNTQSSSQWDGFKHYAYQDSKLFYNGATIEEVTNPASHLKNGIQHFSKAGIVGRGVLLDFWAYSQKQGNIYDPLSGHAISLDELEQCRKAQKLDLKPGDILLIRTGHMVAYASASDERKQAVANTSPAAFAGVRQEKRVLEWIWDSKFAAVGGDTVAWEVMPPVGDFWLHPYILSGLGCPIGELFDLEALSEICQKENRWSFFFTSAPLNLPGGAASPPCALAIF